MKEAVILSTARTGLGKSFRGTFNDTHGATMAGHVLEHAVARAGIAPGEVEDVILGCALPEAATGMNIARLSAIRAGLPVSAGGVTVNRFCVRLAGDRHGGAHYYRWCAGDGGGRC